MRRQKGSGKLQVRSCPFAQIDYFGDQMMIQCCIGLVQFGGVVVDIEQVYVASVCTGLPSMSCGFLAISLLTYPNMLNNTLPGTE